MTSMHPFYGDRIRQICVGLGVSSIVVLLYFSKTNNHGGGGQYTNPSLGSNHTNRSMTTHSEIWLEACAMAEIIEPKLEYIETWFNFTRGRTTVGNMSYVPISKVGSEMMHQNIRKMRSLSINPSKECNFTLVRDPIERFISGYTEFEWRFQQGLKRLNNYTMSLENITFNHHPNGSGRRAEHFLKDLLGGALLIPLEDSQDTNNPLRYRGAFRHLSSMCGQLSGNKITCAAWLNDLPLSWNHITECCGIQGYELNGTIGQHPTSRDPKKVGRAMRLLLAERLDLCKAICKLHTCDFRMISKMQDINYDPVCSCSEV